MSIALSVMYISYDTKTLCLPSYFPKSTKDSKVVYRTKYNKRKFGIILAILLYGFLIYSLSSQFTHFKTTKRKQTCNNDNTLLKLLNKT